MQDLVLMRGLLALPTSNIYPFCSDADKSWPRFTGGRKSLRKMHENLEPREGTQRC